MESRIRTTLTDAFDGDVAAQAELENLGGHASLRIYWRISLPTDIQPPRAYPRGESTLMAMVLPAGIDPMESAEGLSSDAPTPRALPFVEVQRYLAEIGMPVPAIDRVDMERGVLLIEDLGDRLFEHAVLEADDPDAICELYGEAIDLLIRFQSAVHTRDRRTQDPAIVFERKFDRELLMWELHHYREWGLKARLGEDAISSVSTPLQRLFDRLVDDLLDLPQTTVLRDYQSRNIMHKKNTWILIDFQDALQGPFIYDLVALLRDSYVDLPEQSVDRLVGEYASRGADAGLPWCTSAEAVRRAFYLQTVQRKLKDAGRFVYIDREKNNSDFLDYYGPSIQYVRHALDQLDDYEALAELFSDVEPAYDRP